MAAAAAALRHAARRMGTQAAAAQRLSAELKKLPGDEKKKEAAIRLLLIQQKKEELYTLIDGVESEFWIKGFLGMHNTRLLNQLSLQVKPRHDDPRWRSSRRWAIGGECFKCVGAFFIGKMAGEGLVHVYHEVRHPGGK